MGRPPTPQNEQIATNLAEIRHRISEAEARYGRASGSVTLLAVSKTRSAAEVEASAAQGQRRFGENVLQEALDKIDEVADETLEWHFIGSVQTNKTRRIAESFHWVHSLDRLKIACRLSEQRPTHLPALNVCIQVNISGEVSKSGIQAAELSQFVAEVRALPRLNLRGLMAIPAPMPEFDSQRQAFRKLRELKERLRDDGCELDTLSMGMSADMEAAIAEGTTMVRIGTALFGARQQI
jgi:hypothetical protein